MVLKSIISGLNPRTCKVIQISFVMPEPFVMSEKATTPQLAPRIPFLVLVLKLIWPLMGVLEEPSRPSAAPLPLLPSTAQASGLLRALGGTLDGLAHVDVPKTAAINVATRILGITARVRWKECHARGRFPSAMLRPARVNQETRSAQLHNGRTWLCLCGGPGDIMQNVSIQGCHANNKTPFNKQANKPIKRHFHIS